ncbi:hypothetical protein KO481_05975 [Nocardia sp. NEAU-G5]|uniref:Uncharacterized protein n=1 Tax=Nocardia albiluteola TaxID=2842303 RepID=A0ABS6ASQ6_9NOCA|nr:hypothetical protein [Nocardia albiluteola]MBU3061068.1 hypothetical protein [Nocardia albiluteola]
MTIKRFALYSVAAVAIGMLGTGTAAAAAEITLQPAPTAPAAPAAHDNATAQQVASVPSTGSANLLPKLMCGVDGYKGAC